MWPWPSPVIIYFFIPSHIVSYCAHNSVNMFVNLQCYWSSMHWDNWATKNKSGILYFNCFKNIILSPSTLTEKPLKTLNALTFANLSFRTKCYHRLEISFCLQCCISSATHLRPRIDIWRWSKIHMKTYLNHHQYFRCTHISFDECSCKITKVPRYSYWLIKSSDVFLDWIQYRWKLP